MHLRHNYIVNEVYFSGYCCRVRIYTNIKIVIQPTTHAQISERKSTFCQYLGREGSRLVRFSYVWLTTRFDSEGIYDVFLFVNRHCRGEYFI